MPLLKNYAQILNLEDKYSNLHFDVNVIEMFPSHQNNVSNSDFGKHALALHWCQKLPCVTLIG